MRKVYLLFMLLLTSFFLVQCSKESRKEAIDLRFGCLDEKLEEISNVLDTAKIGDADGTYPKEAIINLQKALLKLQDGKSLAMAEQFVLQYEVDNYCIAARKNIDEFKNTLQITLPPGTEAELKVMGIDQKGYIDFGASPDYIGSSSFTVESWLKYDSGFYEFAIGVFIATFNNSAQPMEGWMINFMGQNLRATIGMGPHPVRLFEWGSAYPTNYGDWNHIAMVYDESLPEGQLKMYVNGQVFFSKTNDIVDETNTIQKYQKNVVDTRMWAFQQPTDQSRCLTGYMKKFRIWNSAKSESEINALMESEVNGNEDGLLCAWDFTKVPADVENIPDKTGRHAAKLVGQHKWYKTAK